MKIYNRGVENSQRTVGALSHCHIIAAIVDVFARVESERVGPLWRYVLVCLDVSSRAVLKHNNGRLTPCVRVCRITLSGGSKTSDARNIDGPSMPTSVYDRVIP